MSEEPKSADRSRKRIIQDTRSRWRALQPSQVFTAQWFDTTEMQVTPMAQVALAEALEQQLSCRAQNASQGFVAHGAAWIPLVAHEIRPIPPEGFSACEDSKSNLAKKPHLHNVSGTFGSMGVNAEAETVWERGAIVSRLAIEEGKVNALLRMYTECVQYLFENGFPHVPATAVMTGTNYLAESLTFLAHCGCLLRGTLSTVESLQTADVQELLSHVHYVFANSVGLVATPFHSDFTTPPPPPQRNPLPASVLELVQVQCVGWLEIVFSFIDNLSAHDIIVRRAIEDGAWATVQRVILAAISPTVDGCNVPLVTSLRNDPSLRVTMLRFLSATLRSEAFAMRQESFFPDRGSKDQFVTAVDGLLKLHYGAGPLPLDVKKDLRPLIDLMMRYK